MCGWLDRSMTAFCCCRLVVKSWPGQCAPTCCCRLYRLSIWTHLLVNLLIFSVWWCAVSDCCRLCCMYTQQDVQTGRGETDVGRMSAVAMTVQKYVAYLLFDKRKHKICVYSRPHLMMPACRIVNRQGKARQAVAQAHG